MPTIRFRTTYNSPNSHISFKCCRDAASTEDAERQIMALFPDATNLQTFPENGADSRDADGNRIDWSEAAQGVNTRTIAQTIEEAIKEHTTAERVQICLQRGRLVAYVNHVELACGTIVFAGSDVSARGHKEIAKVEAKHHGRNPKISVPVFERFPLLDGQITLEITTIIIS